MIATFLSANVFADNVSLNPTLYLERGKAAPWSGYLIEFERLEKSVLCVQELKAEKSYRKLEFDNFQTSWELKQKEFELQLTKERSERKFVEEGLKARLAEKEVWYKQPFWVATFTVVGISAIAIAAIAISGN